MGIEAITHSASGTLVVPSTNAEWLEWVSATRTRNYLLDDMLVDWLDLYGQENGFHRDSDQTGFDPRTNFLQFLFHKARDFESAVSAYLESASTVVRIASQPDDARSLGKAEETFRAMEAGVPVIYQGVLRDAESRTYGIPDLLLRSDELARLFPGVIETHEVAQAAQDLGGARWHYRVVDIKFTTLDLLAGGDLGNGGSNPAYKGQLYIYNRALGRIQGYLPLVSYLLGRSWKQTQRSVTSRGVSCMERLAPVPQNSTLSKGMSLAMSVEDAARWVRRVRRDGRTWSVLPDPTVPELRPNMGGDLGGDWTVAKHHIAGELQELTLLWYVGVEKRRDANNLGIFRWSDQNCTAASIGVTGPKTQPVLQAILDINRSDTAPVAPVRVTAAANEWSHEPELEFYVDFETVSDLDDDFSQMPNRGGGAMLFMIGCGHVENGAWVFRCFTADALTEACEATVIDAWLAHMQNVRAAAVPAGAPMVIHWSHAETSFLRDAYNAAMQRNPHRANEWSTPNWFDFLKQVIKAEPVVVRGAWGFGLKKITKALHEHGFVDTVWDDGPVDGLGAMVGAWWCAAEAARRNVPVSQIDLMQEIQRYNEVDCKAMMEIVRYLRLHHCGSP